MNPSARVLTVSTIAFTLLFAVWLMFGVLGVPIKEELHLDTVQFSWLTAIAILSGSIWRLPLGILTDRVGGRRLMTLLLFATAVPCLFVAYAHSYAQLMVCAFLFGVAGNSFSVGIAWNAAWADRARQGFALGVFGAGNVGASVTKLIGPALIALVPAGTAIGFIPGGWRFVPVLYAALLVVMGAALWLASPTPDRHPGSGRALRELLAPLREVRTWRFGLYYVVVFGAYVALSLWLPAYYKRVFGLPLAKAALLTALFIFPASLLRPVGGWLSDRFGARPVTYAVFIAMLLACVPLATAHISLGRFVLLIEVLGIGMGLGKASVYKYIAEYFPNEVGAAGGLVGTLGALGGFLLPLGFGYLDKSSGRPESCFWIMGALVLACLVWLHTVVSGIRRRNTQRLRTLAVDPVGV
ncbi:MAG TPA: nitrate/nitrite transporter [Polyangia bacterium]|jgi:NNP family nitrate/nitrite transporter-like MFS transporter|nr:nitrate/nitrite transporter [Polyangia bacterium]